MNTVKSMLFTVLSIVVFASCTDPSEEIFKQSEEFRSTEFDGTNEDSPLNIKPCSGGSDPGGNPNC